MSETDRPVFYDMYGQLLRKERKIAVIGLGYVGLPIALEFAKYFSVIGFDINQDRILQMQQNIDPSREIDPEEFADKDIVFTHLADDLKQAHFYVIAVPTPVDQHKVPNLLPLLMASQTVGKVLKKGDYVVYESTVYPGCTEEDCLPILEQFSGLQHLTEFKTGYSPERINPGDKEHSLTKVVKVVSGCDDDALQTVAKVYETAITAGVHKAASIKVAEAAKVIENTQRDLNIALMNELSIIFSRMGINTYEVLAAARTKWNFLPFYPGLVGGHCIGVDPYYLTYKSTELGYKPEVILSGRRVNDFMSSHIAKRVVQLLIKAGKDIGKTKALVMGVTFKENVSDIRNSKVAELVRELQSFSIEVDLTDPFANSDELNREYELELTGQIGNDYDCIIVAVKHTQYAQMTEQDFLNLSSANGILIDIKGCFTQKPKSLIYWTL
jgi:UDP-N-acetyl-D-galactosamine dehydrogenase